MEFYIGDKVRVIGFKNIDDIDIKEDEIEILLGATGEIVKVYNTNQYPLQVYFDKDFINEMGYELWASEELELVNGDREQFDVCVDDDNVDIMDWIQSHFHNGNWYKNFEVTITLKEFEYDEDGEKKYV
jgi:LEA14-like dessication related protein